MTPRPASAAASASSSTRTRNTTRLAELLGEQAWRASGLGAPTDIEELQQRIRFLEQQAVDLRLQLQTRDDELVAARGTNRELMGQLNGTRHAG